MIPTTAQVELPILQRLEAKGVTSLVSLEGVDLEIPAGIRGMDNRGNFLLSRLGIAFRRWCRKQRIETPPSVWNLALIGRSDSDSKNSYPVLDSNVKAAHCKPILFFLSGVATEISTQCGCILLDDWNVTECLFGNIFVPKHLFSGACRSTPCMSPNKCDCKHALKPFGFQS